MIGTNTHALLPHAKSIDCEGCVARVGKGWCSVRSPAGERFRWRAVGYGTEPNCGSIYSAALTQI